MPSKRPTRDHDCKPQELLTKDELSERIKLTTRRIDQYVAIGLPYYAVGAGRRFDLSEVLAWFAARG